MRIKIVSVEVNAVPGKKYKQIEVAYKDDKDQLKGKKVMDFGIKNGKEILIEAKAGDVLDITVEQSGQYWNWIGVAKAGEAAATSGGGASRTYSGGGRDFETKEERAQRQILIVRQSSLSSAIALLKTEKNTPTVMDVLGVARQFEDYVFGQGGTQPSAEEDVPV